MQLVLSLFTGVGLLDKAFREAGFCVVSAGDIIYGQDIRDFTGMKNKFDGIIGGSPCQDFSTLKRERGTYSLKMLYEYIRIVQECEPDWYLLENVRGVPNVIDLPCKNVTVPGVKNKCDSTGVTLLRDKYTHQRFDINQSWYDDFSRLRHIQFGSKNGLYLDIPRGVPNQNLKGGCALASDDRTFKELCKIQGLDKDFNLPDFTVKGKKKLVGNGVPLSIGRVLANEVKRVTARAKNKCDAPGVTLQLKICACGCGRSLTGKKKTYDATCRKRLSRKNKCDYAA